MRDMFSPFACTRNRNQRAMKRALNVSGHVHGIDSEREEIFMDLRIGLLNCICVLGSEIMLRGLVKYFPVVTRMLYLDLLGSCLTVLPTSFPGPVQSNSSHCVPSFGKRICDICQANGPLLLIATAQANPLSAQTKSSMHRDE